MRLKKRVISFIVCLAFVSSCPMTLGDSVVFEKAILSVNASTTTSKVALSIDSATQVAGYRVTVESSDGTSRVLFALRDGYAGYEYYTEDSASGKHSTVNADSLISSTLEGYDNCILNTMVCSSAVSNRGFNSITVAEDTVNSYVLKWSQSNTDGQTFSDFLDSNVVAQNNLYEIIFSKVKGNSSMATSEDNFSLRLEPVFAVEGFDTSLGQASPMFTNMLLTPRELLEICNKMKNTATRIQFFGNPFNADVNTKFLDSLREGNDGCNYYSIELLADTTSQIDKFVIPTRPYITFHRSDNSGNQIINLVSMPDSVWSDIVEVFEYVREEGREAPTSQLYNALGDKVDKLKSLYKQALAITNDYDSSYKETYKEVYKAITDFYSKNNIVLASYEDNEDDQVLTITGNVLSNDSSVHDIDTLWSYEGFDMYIDYSNNPNGFGVSCNEQKLNGFPAKFYLANDNLPVKFAKGSCLLLSEHSNLGEITLTDLLEHPYSLFIEASVSAEDEEPVNSLQESLQPPVLLCYEDDSQTESSLTISKSIWEKYLEIYNNLITGSGKDANTVFNPTLSGVAIDANKLNTNDLKQQWNTLKLFQIFKSLPTEPQPVDLTGTTDFLMDMVSSAVINPEYNDEYPEQNRSASTSNISVFTESKDYSSGWLLEKLVGKNMCLSVEDSLFEKGYFSGTMLGTGSAYYANTDDSHSFPFFETGFDAANYYDFTKYINSNRFEDTRSIVASCFTDEIVNSSSANPIKISTLSTRKKSNVNPTVIEGNDYYVVNSKGGSIPTSFSADGSINNLEVFDSSGNSKTFNYGEKLTFTCSDKVVVKSSVVMNPGKNLGEGDEYWGNSSVENALKVSTSDKLYDPVVIHIKDDTVITYEHLREFATTGKLQGVDYEIKKKLSVGELLADPYSYGLVYTSLSEQSVGSAGSSSLVIPSYVHSLNAKISGRTGLPLLSDFINHSELKAQGSISGDNSTSHINSYFKASDATLNSNGDAMMTFTREFGTASDNSISLIANNFQHSVLKNGDSKGRYSSVAPEKNISLLKIDSDTLEIKSPVQKEGKKGETVLAPSSTKYNCYDNGTSIHLKDVSNANGYTFHPYWLQYEATDTSPYYSLGKSATIPVPYRAYTGKTGYYFGSTNTKDSTTDYSYSLAKVYNTSRIIEYKPAVYVDIEFNDCLKLKTNWATDKTSLELMSKSGFPVTHAGQAVTATTQSNTGYTVTVTATTLIPKAGLDSEVGMNNNGRFSNTADFEKYIKEYYVWPLTDNSGSKVKDAAGAQFKTSMKSGLASTLRGVYYDSSTADTENLSKLSAFDFTKSVDPAFTVSESQYQVSTTNSSFTETSNATSLFMKVAENQADIEALITNKSNSKYYEAYSTDLSDLVNPSSSTNVNEYQIADYFDMVTLTYTITVDCPNNMDFVVDLEESDSRNTLEYLDTDKMHGGTASDYVIKGSVLGDVLSEKSVRDNYIQAWQDYFGESIVDSNTFSCYNSYASLNYVVDYCYSHFLVPYVTVDLGGYLKALGATCESGNTLSGHKVTLTDNLGVTEEVTRDFVSPTNYLVGGQTWLNVYGNIYDNT